MKQFLILSAFAIACTFSANAQYINIPDPNFKNYMMTRYPGCFNASEMMDTTCAAIINETVFSSNSYISDWQGFQYLRNLEYVYFGGGYATAPVLPATIKTIKADLFSSISTLPVLPNGLLTLDCQDVHGITSIPALPNTLVHLRCSNCNQLTSLPSLPASLQYLNVSDNYFTSLPALSTALDTLICSSNSLTALPALPAGLSVLDCSNNDISVLPTLPAGLKSLNFSGNAVSTLSSLPPQLEILYADDNQIASLPTLPVTLLGLHVPRNNIAVIPALPAGLIELDVNYNNISIVPALPASLQSLNCVSNDLNTCPFPLPAGLLLLDISENQIGGILPTLPNGLQTLRCTDNQLTGLPAFPQTLTTLYCPGNQLTSIPSFPASLITIECGGNQITDLPVLPVNLYLLNCSYNQIGSLSNIPPQLQFLRCDHNNITCLPVLFNNGVITGLRIDMDSKINCVPNPEGSVSLTVFDDAGVIVFNNSASSYPLCSAVNNFNHCAAFPLMTGHVYYDNNNNGTHDVNEPYKANAEVQLSDGSFTFTDNNGYYQIASTDTGVYSTSVTAPPFFAAVPPQYNFNFNSFDTLVINNFAYQATTTADSLGISIIPIGTPRPGFPHPYLISYENDGTTTLNPNIVFNYDNTRLTYDSSSNASVIHTGSSLTLTETGFVPGMQKSFVGYFTLNPTAVIGDSLRAGAHITSGSTAVHDSDVVVIRGSFDPNDKSATPTLSPAQVTNGDYINYTIRFQNTGTDTAFSIVVTDTLDNKLQPSTLQMIATSHPCITTVKDNKVSFEFLNILLPDSNVNQLKSHGYISFRIKPVNTLVVNDIVPNKAAIYFDYNSPVITDIATTIVVDPIVVPLKLMSFIVSRGVGSNANLYWQTSNEVSVKNYEIEMSNNGRTFNSIGFENAKGFQNNSYTKTIPIPKDPVLYFRLKMIDIDGRFTYSNIAILKNDNVTSAFSFQKNPVKDELNISLQDEGLRNTTATIFSSQGVKVKTILLQHDVESVNIRSLPAGSYYLVTEKGSRQFVVVK